MILSWALFILDCCVDRTYCGITLLHFLDFLPIFPLWLKVSGDCLPVWFPDVAGGMLILPLRLSAGSGCLFVLVLCLPGFLDTSVLSGRVAAALAGTNGEP